MSAVSATNSALQLSGLASGIDWTSIINEMLTVARAPETQMTAQQTTDNQKKSAYQAIGTNLTALGNDVNTLSNPSFFQSRTTSVSDPSIASATAAEGTPLGNFSFAVTQMASDSAQVGMAVASKPISSSNNVTGVVLGSAGFSTPVTAGTFSVNGHSITIATSDTLQSVFTQISSATGGAVTASYNSVTDEISLASSSPILLGSATDTSNFLQAAQLYGNGTGAVTSTSALGGLNLNSTISAANLVTPISDGGSGNGEFLINGVQINYNASTDAINDVLQRINSSAAGVTATYDGTTHSFKLTSNTTGDLGISLKDVTGNFVAATGLSGGTLQSGKNLEYSVNGGGTQISESNVVDATLAGLPGLSIAAQGVGSAIVNVGSDVATIATAVQNFVADYNAAQTFISSQTSTSTSSTGTTTPGMLTGDMDAENIAFTMRQLVGNAPAGSSGAVLTLSGLGIQTDGTDNLLTTPDTATLTNAITNNLSDVQNLFTNSVNGVATSLASYVKTVNGTNGVLANNESEMTTDSANLTKSISTLNQQISSEQTELTKEFTAMEEAINTINSQKQYLNAYFSGSAAATNAAPTAAGSSFGASGTSGTSSGG